MRPLQRVLRRSMHTGMSAAEEAVLRHAQRLLEGKRRVLAITGAGISTESGIPDYRSPGRPPHRPTSHQTFMSSHATRQRYWARSMQGYETLANSLPNAGHYALAYAERAGRLLGTITQNVDLLHEAAGAREVLHLHGTVREVRCMSCEALHSRAEFQADLRRLNPTFLQRALHSDPALDRADHQLHARHAGATSTQLPTPELRDRPIVIPANQRPDGDSDLAHVTDYSSFVVPSCRRCTDGFGRPLAKVTDARHAPDQPAGILKPDLVFFGANVPRHVHARADELVARADALLIAGTSLTVWSAFRLVRAALDRAVPGHSASVVQVAEQLAKLRPPSSASTGGNVIENGSALLAPVTPFELNLSGDSSSGLRRVPAPLPVVIVNQGPTRADPFLAAADWGVVKVAARTGQALHTLLDVPREATREMERQVTAQHQASGAKVPLQAAAVEEAMKRHENIE